MDTTLQVAILVLAGTVIAAVLTYRGTNAATELQRRKARQDYLISRMDILSKCLGQYEEWLTKRGENRVVSDFILVAEHARIIGEAIAACLAVGDLPNPESDISGKDVKLPNIPEMPYRLDKKTQEVHRLGYIANKRLTRNLVCGTEGPSEKAEVEKWGLYDDRNRHALDHAVKRLAQLIEQAT